jgi:hypothetical protein
MPLNWSKVGEASKEPVLGPRDISAALPYLRHEKGEVLDKWFDRRDDRDMVIKQNTGGGKTVAGLLIAQSILNQEIGRAVYLTPERVPRRAGHRRASPARPGHSDGSAGCGVPLPLGDPGDHVPQAHRRVVGVRGGRR